MNAKTARKLRKHIEIVAHPERRKEAIKALKVLVQKGQVKFGKQ